VRPRAAGTTWGLVTGDAPWAGRALFTAVIDAAGTIYLMGGTNAEKAYNDVWQSTGAGANVTWSVLKYQLS
jgi:hypothetical protein